MADVVLSSALARKISARNITPEWPAQYNESAWTGTGRIVLLPGIEKHRFSISFRPLVTETEAREARAFFYALKGIVNTFKLPYLPTSQAGGATSVSAGGAVGTRTVTVTSAASILPGMPISVSLPSGHERPFVVISKAGNVLTVEPAFSESAIPGATVNISDPTCRVRLADPRFTYSDEMGRVGFSVDVVEAIDTTAAGGGNAPVNTVAPLVSGTPNVGLTLSTTNGTWTNSPTGYAYQWQRDGVDIGGANANTYTQVSADIGAMIRCEVIASNAFGSSSPSVSNAVGPVTGSVVTLANTLIKLKDSSPLLRNDNNTASPLEIKAGPQGLILIGSTPTMWFEAIQNTGFAANNGRTAPMKATAPKWQGPWTVSPATLVLVPGDTTTWEYNEFSPSEIINNSGTLVMFAHGGNNNAPRQIGRAVSTDGTTGEAWTKDAGNPILPNGAAGAFDDKIAADLKLIRHPSTGEWIGLYRGVKNGDSKVDGTVGRVTLSADLTTLTKTGQVISAAPAWNTTGVATGGLWFDAGGRLHMFSPGGAAGIGYYYSDDKGLTWTVGNGGNRVLVPGSDYDPSAGDVVQAIQDGDVLFITYGANNLSYSTNPPLRAIAGAITPARNANPARKGKFYLSGAYTTTGVGAMLAQSTFSIMGRFRAYRIDRTQYREIYTEEAAFNKEVFVRLEGGGGANAGKLSFFFRTPTNLLTITSASTYDDAAWHTFLVRRISSGSWELYVDGAVVGTSAVNPSTDATAAKSAVGNWDQTAGIGNEPANMTISDFGLVTGYAATAAEATNWINSRTALGGGTVVFDSALNGSDNGDVALVDATP